MWLQGTCNSVFCLPSRHREVVRGLVGEWLYTGQSVLLGLVREVEKVRRDVKQPVGIERLHYTLVKEEAATKRKVLQLVKCFK